MLTLITEEGEEDVDEDGEKVLFEQKWVGEEGLLTAKCDEGGRWARPRNAGIERRRRSRKASTCV